MRRQEVTLLVTFDEQVEGEPSTWDWEDLLGTSVSVREFGRPTPVPDLKEFEFRLPAAAGGGTIVIEAASEFVARKLAESRMAQEVKVRHEPELLKKPETPGGGPRR